MGFAFDAIALYGRSSRCGQWRGQDYSNSSRGNLDWRIIEDNGSQFLMIRHNYSAGRVIAIWLYELLLHYDVAAALANFDKSIQ